MNDIIHQFCVRNHGSKIGEKILNKKCTPADIGAILKYDESLEIFGITLDSLVIGTNSKESYVLEMGDKIGLYLREQDFGKLNKVLERLLGETIVRAYWNKYRKTNHCDERSLKEFCEKICEDAAYENIEDPIKFTEESFSEKTFRIDICETLNHCEEE